jgi:hypothetical protein
MNNLHGKLGSIHKLIMLMIFIGVSAAIYFQVQEFSRKTNESKETIKVLHLGKVAKVNRFNSNSPSIGITSTTVQTSIGEYLFFGSVPLAP